MKFSETFLRGRVKRGVAASGPESSSPDTPRVLAEKGDDELQHRGNPPMTSLWPRKVSLEAASQSTADEIREWVF